MERVEEKLFVAIYVGEKNRWQEKSRTLVGVGRRGKENGTGVVHVAYFYNVSDRLGAEKMDWSGARRQAPGHTKDQGQPHKVREYGYPDEQG